MKEEHTSGAKALSSRYVYGTAEAAVPFVERLFRRFEGGSSGAKALIFVGPQRPD
jgi:hypothetical protein